jgi:uncharacterized protein (TIGR02231 family)
MVGGAAWKPLYDVRLGGEALAVTYLASVTQTSGEDWLGTDLTLSTARPMEGAEIPELDPWYIDARVPQPIPPPSPKAAGAFPGGPMRMAMAAAPMAEAAPTATMMAEVESSGAAVTYHIARPVNIPSDGAPHRTTVTVLDLKAALDYVTAPKLAEQAYLRAKTKNTSPYLLLPGAANVFHENDLVGATVFETIAPNQEFEVHLGADDRIKVERELVERTVDKTLIGNTRRLFFNYKITLTNLLTTPARVTVLDQIPKSRNEELKVKLRDANPRPTEQDDMNILKWELELKPQEKREITFGFAIEHPREMRLIGISE